jgi:hypothetical protein
MFLHPIGIYQRILNRAKARHVSFVVKDFTDAQS